MLKLFHSPGSCAFASHIALAESGATYEPVLVNFAADEQRSAPYLEVNPKGRVPTLVTDRGILTETPAILAYIAQTFPAARLAPLDDAFAFARVQSFNSYLCSTVHVAHAHRGRGYRWVPAENAAALDAMRGKVGQNMAECFELIERGMIAGPWVMGDSYTICDPYLFTIAGWLEGDGVDIARFPKVSAHHRAMAARPAVLRARAEQKPAA